MKRTVVPTDGRPPASYPQWPVVSVLGFCQILACDSTCYLSVVLAVPIVRSTGWPAGGVVGSLFLGFLVSGVVSPAVGRTIDRRGSHPVLAASTVPMAVGLCGLALSPNLLVDG